MTRCPWSNPAIDAQPAGGTGPNDMNTFNTALTTNGGMAQFNFVVPNECEDGHDNCKPIGNGVTEFDNFLSNGHGDPRCRPECLDLDHVRRGHLEPRGRERSPVRRRRQRRVLGAGADGAAGVTSSTVYDHYSLLRTLEDGYGLSHLGGAQTSSPITGIW